MPWGRGGERCAHQLRNAGVTPMIPTPDRDTQAARMGLLVCVVAIYAAFAIVPPLAKQWRAQHPQRQEAGR